MINRKFVFLIAFILAFSGISIHVALQSNLNTAKNNSKLPPPSESETKPDYGAIPLHFEPNVGQIDEKVRFLSRGKGYTLLLTGDEAILALQNKSNVADRDAESNLLKMKIVGANQSAQISSENELEGKTNYIVGSDPKDWKTDVSNFERVRYTEIYDGVDAVFYGNQHNLEYDFIVAPNVSPAKIALEFDGAKNIEQSDNGDLVFKFERGDLRQHKPFVYQEINGERIEIAAAYSVRNPKSKIRNPTIGFEIGEYDRSKPLVIDPVLSYSTFLGGSGDFGLGGESGQGIAVDPSGNAYVVGFTNSAAQFPLVGAFQTQIGTNLRAAFVTKINAAGTAFVYSTYLSGAQQNSNNGNTTGFGIAVDNAGKAYVVGVTQSCNFPTTAGAYIPANPGIGPGCSNGIAGFLAKLNAAGNGLDYSTYIASPTNFTFYGDACCPEVRGVAVDSSGSAYVTGFTNQPTFPTTAGAFRPAPAAAAGNDVFVMKFNPAGSGLIYSTFLGGSNTNAPDIFARQGSEPFSIALDAQNNAIVSGDTNSASFPVTNGAAQPFYAGFLDGFVTKINSTGTGLIYSTYLGGSGRDGEPTNAAVDASGNTYVELNTQSANFPVTPTSFRPFSDGGRDSPALVKLNANGGLVYSTFIVNAPDAFAFDVASDANGSATVVGSSNQIFPVNPVISSGGNFLVKFNQSGTGLIFGTYLSGTTANAVSFGRSITLDSSGNTFITGNTNDTTFPTTAGAPQTVNRGGGSNNNDTGDAFVSKISLLPNDCPAITINPQPIRPAIKGQNYNQQLSATGGTAPYNYSLFPNTNSQLPNGITLSTAGLLSGIVSNNNGVTARIAIRAADANGCVGVRPYSLKIFRGVRPFDFDGDLKADIAVFRPTNGSWYFLNSFSNQKFKGVAFGQSGDVPAAGDFDGDGVFDISVFRPSNGYWYRLDSLTGNFAAVPFGQNGDVPIVGDYDGDGRSDIAVFRPSTGGWYLLQSQNGFTGTIFGASSDVPAAADYDGDGRNDICVFRPSNGYWYRLNSSDGAFVAYPFGQSGDVPVRGDYDNDGKADIAVFRPSSGSWYIQRSQQGFSGTAFGQSGDIPVPSDYDGDSVADIAVFRPSNGTWYLLQSSNGFTGAAFGANGDIPIPALP